MAKLIDIITIIALVAVIIWVFKNIGPDFLASISSILKINF